MTYVREFKKDQKAHDVTRLMTRALKTNQRNLQLLATEYKAPHLYDLTIAVKVKPIPAKSKKVVVSEDKVFQFRPTRRFSNQPIPMNMELDSECRELCVPTVTQRFTNHES
ncbi:hypothetical protein NDU88_001212 [Pleurodeles waltl]|uniref:Uncharacterized protein n=1 Tax=Pleurodeles waltl TaxID=8319 RepID=A0AAV7P379_PLEWA|nr:hypothetical protein NDU88_001212 [Pleurodeles waltl]